MSNYQKLIKVLTELFQLDQADLDFGIYRVMNQKRDEILAFLNKDLLPQVKQILQENLSTDKADVQEELNKLIETLKSAGMNPDDSPKVKELKSQLGNAVNLESIENEVFSHLAGFFKRYYDNGDFISLRRYKKDVYAIPYEGEEVKLHWANHDQYYIKSSEYLKNYSFKINDDKKVNFVLVEASTEQNNNKAQNNQERRFAINTEQVLQVENDELNIYFTYELYEKKVKQKDLIDTALETIRKELPGDFSGALKPMPTEKNKTRTLLEKHLIDYTSRNTFDYFIHKDLGGFLSRELDFYIKNEVLFIDDINTHNEKDFLNQLSLIKAVKNIGAKIITFLAQLEDFQKKLWLKKKFVIDTNYCITLDKIPEQYYPEIIENKAQIQEWIDLFAIDEIKQDAITLGYSEPLTIEFLKANPFLVLDTKFFSEDFKENLISEFDNLDNEVNGILINSDNFQAINILENTYKNQIDCIYIDPPYNTDATPILYKNNYKDSSWISLIYERVIRARKLLKNELGVLSVAIDDVELDNLGLLLKQALPNYELQRAIVNHYPGSGTGRSNISRTHEYNLFLLPNDSDILRGKITRDGARERNFRRAGTGENNYRTGRPNSFFAVIVDKKSLEIKAVEKPPSDSNYPTHETEEGYLRIYPIGSDGSERVWSLSYEGAKEAIKENRLRCTQSLTINRVYYDEQARSLVDSMWTNSRYNATTHGTNLLTKIFGDSSIFSYPKSLYTVITAIDTITHDYKNPVILDFFAGSGTTAHATIELNRKEGNRKYILVEMGDYFYKVTKPRVQKVIYSNSWDKGKPLSREGSSQLFKYFTLESYEDTLNNLALKKSEKQQELLHSDEMVKESYMLSYMLDVESEGSLLSTESFVNPFDYRMNITRNNETRETKVDLIETFNYLIGLHVETSERIKEFKVITGHNNEGEKILIIWRNLNEKSNQDLDEFFLKQSYNTRDTEFDRIYVNGDNNLENLKVGDELWKVALIEEEFKTRMFDTKDL
jgi:adenine-specific DNA-methyltransferase